MGFWDSLNKFTGSPLGALAIGLGTEAIASGIQRRGINRNVQAQQQSVQRAEERATPYAQAGERGLMRIQDILGEDTPQQFQFDQSKVALDPGYEFRMAEARKALARSQAARLSTGGAALKELDQYTQGLASQEYGTAYEREYKRQMDTYQSGETSRQGRFGRALTVADMGAGTTARLQDLDTSYGALEGGGAMARSAVNAGAVRRIGAAVDPFNRAIDRFTLNQVTTPYQPTRKPSRARTIQYNAETGDYE